MTHPATGGPGGRAPDQTRPAEETARDLGHEARDQAVGLRDAAVEPQMGHAFRDLQFDHLSLPLFRAGRPSSSHDTGVQPRPRLFFGYRQPFGAWACLTPCSRREPVPVGEELREAELIDAALRGDPDAERAIYDAHVDRVFRLAYRICGDGALAEDLTQDTFVRAFRYLPGFRGQSALSTWLHSIAMSVILNGLRKVRPMDRWTEVDEKRVVGRSPQQDRELGLTLARSVDELPEKLRTVFLMHDVEGFKHAEIAGALDIPTGTSKARLSRAREKLRAALGEPGRRAAAKEGSR